MPSWQNKIYDARMITPGSFRLPLTWQCQSTPPEAEALAMRLYSLLPRVRVTDLLAEVARWTLFPAYFTGVSRMWGDQAASSDF